MSILDRIRARARDAAESVVRLPIVGRKVLEDPRLERLAAEQGLVPRRCGLCRHFNRAMWVEALRVNPAFAQATGHLEPTQMGVAGSVDSSSAHGSPAARELRPDLIRRWADYGGCSKHAAQGASGIWAFEEAPPMPGPTDPPCKEWTT